MKIKKNYTKKLYTARRSYLKIRIIKHFNIAIDEAIDRYGFSNLKHIQITNRNFGRNNIGKVVRWTSSYIARVAYFLFNHYHSYKEYIEELNIKYEIFKKEVKYYRFCLSPNQAEIFKEKFFMSSQISYREWLRKNYILVNGKSDRVLDYVATYFFSKENLIVNITFFNLPDLTTDIHWDLLGKDICHKYFCGWQKTSKELIKTLEELYQCKKLNKEAGPFKIKSIYNNKSLEKMKKRHIEAMTKFYSYNQKKYRTYLYSKPKTKQKLIY